jgi:hypothetical protein
MSKSDMVIFYTTLPKGMDKDTIEDVILDLIPHGVRKTDVRQQAKFQQVFIHCLIDRDAVSSILRETSRSKNGRARFNYDLGGRTRGYILISEYRPKTTTRATKDNDADVRSELFDMMKLNRALEKEIERLQMENLNLREKASATNQLPQLQMPVPSPENIAPVSPGYCPTSPKAEATTE